MRISTTWCALLASTAVVASDISSNVQLESLALVTPPPLPFSQSIVNQTNLEARQAAPAAGPVQPAAIQQANPTTVYYAGNVPITYVQTFAAVPDQWPSPSSGAIGMGSLTGPVGVTSTINVNARSIKARSEGALGQTPWIGMAVGLTCTALAAVMLG